MSKKSKKFICIVLMLALFCGAAACGKAPERDKNNTQAGAEKTKAPPEIEGLRAFIEAQEVSLLDMGDKINTDVIIGSLGEASLTLDENKLASVNYVPLGGSFSMELKDNGGNTWRLDIPENALPYVETISMQLTSDIQSDALSGQFSGGVVFQPEGVQFMIPATLTVSGPMVAENTCVFAGDSMGKSLDFASADINVNQLMVSIAHFSSDLVYTPETDAEAKELSDKGYKAYKEVLNEVKAFLKTPIGVPPVPPDYTFTCKDEDGESSTDLRNRALDIYVEKVRMPERELARKLLDIGRWASLLGADNDGIYYAQLLQERAVKKVDKLIETYKYDTQKLIPVYQATSIITKDAYLIGADIPPAEHYLGIFYDWTIKALDEELRKIREEHNYKAMGTVIALIRDTAFLASGSGHEDLTQEYLQKLTKAMSFTFNYDVSLFSGIAKQKMALTGKGEISLQYDPARWLYYEGSGEGEYLSYSGSSSSVTTIDFPNAYPVKARIVDFSPCTSQTVDLWVDTIGAEKEVWYNKLLDMRFDDNYNFVNFMAGKLFNEYKCQEGIDPGDSNMAEGYIFKLPFRNGNAIMASEGFTRTDTINYPEEGNATGSITYVIEIRHTPK